MADKMIFLSHIHEERELAQLIQTSLEREFSGFVDVFVSSDGVSIPAGANFLKRIEDSLATCVGALYLISPLSVKRNWINFELGAVWIRNVINVRAGLNEIPTLPICHSGVAPSSLPLPLNNLNAIVANQASELERGFGALQRAVGGRGPLKADFDTVAAQVITFEQKYTLGANLKSALSLIIGDWAMLIKHCEQQPTGAKTTINCGFVETNIAEKLKNYEANELRGRITVVVDKPGIAFRPHGSVNGAEVKVIIPIDLILQFRSLLLV